MHHGIDFASVEIGKYHVLVVLGNVSYKVGTCKLVLGCIAWSRNYTLVTAGSCLLGDKEHSIDFFIVLGTIAVSIHSVSFYKIGTYKIPLDIIHAAIIYYVRFLRICIRIRRLFVWFYFFGKKIGNFLMSEVNVYFNLCRVCVNVLGCSAWLYIRLCVSLGICITCEHRNILYENILSASVTEASSAWRRNDNVCVAFHARLHIVHIRLFIRTNCTKGDITGVFVSDNNVLDLLYGIGNALTQVRVSSRACRVCSSGRREALVPLSSTVIGKSYCSLALAVESGKVRVYKKFRRRCFVFKIEVVNRRRRSCRYTDKRCRNTSKHHYQCNKKW